MAVAPDLTKTQGQGLPHLGSYAFASLPVATSWSGYTAFANDLGLTPGVLMVSDGTRWIPCGVQVLARSATLATAPANTAENTLATIAVPANLMGVNGGMRVSARYSFTASTNAKSCFIRFGGTLFCQGATSTVSFLAMRVMAVIQNRNSAASQVGDNDNSGVQAGNVSYTGTVDTTAAQNITLTGTKTSAGESMVLESYLIEVFG